MANGGGGAGGAGAAGAGGNGGNGNGNGKKKKQSGLRRMRIQKKGKQIKSTTKKGYYGTKTRAKKRKKS
jgi:hypothetical protein